VTTGERALLRFHRLGYETLEREIDIGEAEAGGSASSFRWMRYSSGFSSHLRPSPDSWGICLADRVRPPIAGLLAIFGSLLPALAVLPSPRSILP
jgi:hypothetical protein